MRYLRPFNEGKFENFLKDIRDICLELIDEGYNISSHPDFNTTQSTYDIIQLYIHGKRLSQQRINLPYPTLDPFSINDV